MDDHLRGQITCLNTRMISATLISTTGYHCKVWRSAGVIIQNSHKVALDYVIKKFLGPCSLPETGIYHKHYQMIKAALDEIVPDAVFIASTVDGETGLIVIAATVQPWFNLANPTNEENLIPLLRQSPKTCSQLHHFVRCARAWQHASESKIIDLYGLDNLVLDIHRNVKYIDSFDVFFNADVLYLTDELDEGLQEKINLSLHRLDYLEHVLQTVAQSSS